jgi:hypothetical protein
MSAADSLTLIAGDNDRCGIELGMVTAHGSLYVRAFRGTRSTWFQAALAHGHGRIQVGANVKEVLFRTADPALADQIDAAYQAKYHESSRLVANATARAATVEILPR